MPYLKTLLSLTGLGICLYFGLHSVKMSADSPDPITDIFVDNRSLKHHAKPGTGRPDPQVVKQLEQSPIGVSYAAIKRPDRSLLAYDCGTGSVWCAQPAFSFQSMFGEAAKLANPAHPDPDGLARCWYKAATELDPVLTNDLAPFNSVKDAPFQVLAVANRMDLAHLENGNWVGAEIHIAYGLTPDKDASFPQNLTVILEFEMRPFGKKEFKKLALTWVHLSDVPDAQYGSKLADALVASGFSLDSSGPPKLLRVRSRMNHEVSSGPWRLSQLVLDPHISDQDGRTVFVRAKLDDQIGQHVDTSSRTYLDLWREVQSAVNNGKLEYPIPEDLREGPGLTYNQSPQGMGTPPGMCYASEPVRNVLALQQCSWCHTNETKTRFAHTPNRLGKDASVPSGFLLGQHPDTGKNIHPCLASLYYDEPDVVWTVKITYTTYTATNGTCTTPTGKTVWRSFHDLARRALFLAAIATDSKLQNGAPAAELFSTPFTE